MVEPPQPPPPLSVQWFSPFGCRILVGDACSHSVCAQLIHLRVEKVGPLLPVALLEAVEGKEAAARQPGSLPGAVLAGAKGNVLALQAATTCRGRRLFDDAMLKADQFK